MYYNYYRALEETFVPGDAVAMAATLNLPYLRAVQQTPAPTCARALTAATDTTFTFHTWNVDIIFFATPFDSHRNSEWPSRSTRIGRTSDLLLHNLAVLVSALHQDLRPEDRIAKTLERYRFRKSGPSINSKTWTRTSIGGIHIGVVLCGARRRRPRTSPLASECRRSRSNGHNGPAGELVKRRIRGPIIYFHTIHVRRPALGRSAGVTPGASSCSCVVASHPTLAHAQI